MHRVTHLREFCSRKNVRKEGKMWDCRTNETAEKEGECATVIHRCGQLRFFFLSFSVSLSPSPLSLPLHSCTKKHNRSAALLSANRLASARSSTSAASALLSFHCCTCIIYLFPSSSLPPSLSLTHTHSLPLFFSLRFSLVYTSKKNFGVN